MSFGHSEPGQSYSFLPFALRSISCYIRPWYIESLHCFALYSLSLDRMVVLKPWCQHGTGPSAVQSMYHILLCWKHWSELGKLPRPQLVFHIFYHQERCSWGYWNGNDILTTFHHWLHLKLSFWQFSVQAVTKISSKLRNFRLSGG